MSTRSITVIQSRWSHDEDYSIHARVYRHHDGYLDGHGRTLATFLNGLVVINGIPMNPPQRYANGPGRLAAQYVAYMQEEGHDPDLTVHSDIGEEFIYTVSIDDFGMDGGTISVIVFSVYGGGNILFQGSVPEFEQFLRQEA